MIILYKINSMILILLSIILSMIFTILSGFHFYWFFGGVWGLEKVIPTKSNEESMPSIPKLATLIVAFGLLFFGLIYLMKSEFITIPLPYWITIYSYWFIPSLFIVRAIGDFNYIGYFKKIKTTEFAKADSKIFVPLCSIIGIIGLLIQLIY